MSCLRRPVSDLDLGFAARGSREVGATAAAVEALAGDVHRCVFASRYH